MLPRKTKEDKKVMLNLNVYRNLNHFVLNDIKTLFQPKYFDTEHKCYQSAIISYGVFKIGARKFDTMNIVSVVDKFFCDWLVKNEWLPDDNCDIIKLGEIHGHRNCLEEGIFAEVIFREEV
jgi:hypothetical protein